MTDTGYWTCQWSDCEEPNKMEWDKCHNCDQARPAADRPEGILKQ